MANEAEVLPAAVSTTADPPKKKTKATKIAKSKPTAAASAGTKQKTAAKLPPAPRTHPKVSVMVMAAIRSLQEKHGSSLQAIKKYVSTNYDCDMSKLALFIRRALKKGVEDGTLVHTKGTGASGSFKLKAEPKPRSSNKKPKLEKKPRQKKAAAVEKKQPASGKTGKKKASAAAVTPKQKSTKPSKTAAQKSKAPKPKKATDGKVSPKK